MTGGGAFLTKKHKKLMAARRKKKRMAHEQQETHGATLKDTHEEQVTMTEMANSHGKSTTTTTGAATSHVDRPAKRQKTLSLSLQNSGGAASTTTTTTTTTISAPETTRTTNQDNNNANIHRVVIPSNSSAKEAKKLRKDARRKARNEGWSEDELVFVDEHGKSLQKQQDDDEQQQEPDEATASESRPKAAPSSKKNHPDNKAKKVFPRINDILEQERQKAQIAARQEALQATEAALPIATKNRYVALDCEMVGTGIDGKISVLARVSITDWHGTVLLDTFVQVPTRVTDFRTQWSGVTPGKIQAHNNAMAVETCRKKVAELIKGKILVGHALKNDLDALILTHPKDDIRDTAKYRYYQRLFNKKWRPRKLRDLVLEHLGLVIQSSSGNDGKVGHDSVDDAKAAMELFKLSREAWEKELASKKQKRQRQK